jgi:hypothetical protein
VTDFMPAGEKIMQSSRVPVVFTIRYSLLQKNYKKTFNSMARFEYEEYQRQLFAEDRLRMHFHLFSTLTVPSIVAASRAAPEIDLSVYILTSSELPPSHREALDALLAEHDIFKIVAVSPEVGAPHRECILEALQSSGSESTAYAHCRLDDDDAVSGDFLGRLGSYVRPEFVGFGVSLCSGFLVVYDEAQKISGIYEYNYPKASIGLSVVGHYDRRRHASPKDVINIYEMGSHTKLDSRIPVIIDSMKPAFLRAIHPEQDSMSSELKRLPEPANPELVASCFSLDTASLPSVEQSQANRQSIQEQIVQRAKSLQPRRS